MKNEQNNNKSFKLLFFLKLVQQSRATAAPRNEKKVFCILNRMLIFWQRYTPLTHLSENNSVIKPTITVQFSRYKQ